MSDATNTRVQGKTRLIFRALDSLLDLAVMLCAMTYGLIALFQIRAHGEADTGAFQIAVILLLIYGGSKARQAASGK